MNAKMKLHLGCGKRYIPGFVHIDVIKFDHIDIVASIDDLAMIEDNSVELIYACHVLEHFNWKQAIKTLKEWRRVLKEGGKIRIAVPDFKTCAKLYLEGKVSLNEIHGPLVGGQTYLYNFHYTLFDEEKLKEALVIAGFKDSEINKYDWRKTEHADYDDYSQAYLPHMDKDNGTLISLNVEAKK